ncbi:hypothetical protein LU293_08605 [Moraxella nasovis]|uniref:hypothetical protein n=1 Tax=Moraxella nasovis TaxID=2904121 RepID=UPI001F623E4C|nr:hypothetical protein [Moraxella nasovis]UNU73125.1 hypothetical protein LU293_08605 [Moraxella nasovis]
MKTQHKVISVIAIATALTACQTAPSVPVIERPNKVFETIGYGKTKLSARDQALTYAKSQCGNAHTPIIIKDSHQYHGVLDEKVGRVADQAISVLGGILGKSASISRDDDYEYTVTFRCE